MRVAALLPAATGIVTALGASGQLVAVTHACTLPAGRAVPRVTRSRVAPGDPATIDGAVSDLAASGAPLFDLDAGQLAALAPDVILTQAVCDVCAVREGDVRAAAARIQPAPRIVSLGASTVDGVLADITTVGDAIGAADEAVELVAGLRARIRSVHKRLKRAQAPRPRVAVIEWTDPPFGAGHWVPDIVRRAGGIDVLGAIGEPSRRTTAGDVRQAAPGIIIVAPCGVDLDDALSEARAMQHHPDWRWAADTPLWAIDANALTASPGPGVVRAIEVVAEILHPTIFGAPNASVACDVRLSDS